jgi:NAD(P)H-hydrate epimerase
MGCGISTSDFAKELVCKVLEKCEVPLVLDADALNIIAENPDLLKKAKAPIIITPHNMEMARLMNVSLDVILADREKVAVDFSRKYGVITVLKGAQTYVADPSGKVMVNNQTGNSGMAVAGSGDVLAGITAGLAAQMEDLGAAARLAVFLHGAAGDMGRGAVIADDLPRLAAECAANQTWW